MTPKEKKALSAAIDPLVVKGDYASALAVLKPYRLKTPNEFYLDYLYAKLLGDWADELPTAQKKKRKSESIAILAKLKKRLRGQPLETRWRLVLNYYYQRNDFRGMYAFGQRFGKTDRRRALYAQALAASYLAESSPRWAHKSVKAWSAYGVDRDPYYFVHYSFAKALAYAGDGKAARRRLEIAAKKAKRPITDWEFADVLRLLPAKKT